jgi:hypothetical protein
MPLLPFAQIDLAGTLPLPDGRYVTRPEGEPDAAPDVLAVRTLGAARARSRRRRGRPVPLEREPGAAPLQLTRVTLVKARPLEREDEAADWLSRVSSEERLAEQLLAETTRTVNRALLAHRVAAPDPYATDIHPARSVAVRFGYGTGEDVADGRWRAAVELPETQRRGLRSELIDSVGAQERVAAVLGGRDSVAPYEVLLVEAELAARERRRDLAALTLAAALESLARAGGDVGAAAGAARELQDRALGGREIDEQALSEALRAARRAVRSGPR